MPPESQCNGESLCTIKGTIAYHHSRRTWNEMRNGSFPVNAQIRFELIAEEIEFLAHCFVDIPLIRGVMNHFHRMLHGKQCELNQILAKDQESSSLQSFNYISNLAR